MRLLVILHENRVGHFDDWRRGLSTLKSEGLLADHAVFSFLARRLNGGSHHAIEEEIVAAAADLQATAVLWCHTGDLTVTPATFTRLRDLPSRPVFGYWEGDMYQWPYKPYTRAARSIASASHVVFVPGCSSFSEGLRRDGCLDVRYVPLPTDEARFGNGFKLRRAGAEFDVVLIGNRVTSRIPFKTMPGARQRVELVRLFEQKLGQRFAVFGRGWQGRCAQGPIDFLDQANGCAAGHVMVGNNNIHAGYYFSDRLPIAMTCGSIVVHGWEPGLDRVFGPTPPVRFFRDPQAAWSAVRPLLETADTDLQEERVRARDLALAKLTMTEVQRYMVAVLRELRRSREHRDAPRTILNPWIGGDQMRDTFRADRDRLVALPVSSA